MTLKRWLSHIDSVSCSVNIPMMPQLIKPAITYHSCYTSMWKVICNSLDISYIHCLVHCQSCKKLQTNDDVMKWKHFPRYWPFVRVTGGFPSQRPVTWRFDVSLICAWTNSWENNRDASDLRCHHTHYDIAVMLIISYNAFFYSVCGLLTGEWADSMFLWKFIKV